MKDNYKTVVLFLIEEFEGEETSFAVFPLDDENVTWNSNDYYDKQFPVYAHLGQHSAAHFDYIIEQRIAKQDEYKDLQKELESIGYDLFVLNDSLNHLWINFINDA